MAELSGQVAVITGGGRGIGAAIAMKLATEGADVALSYVSSEQRAREVADRIEALGRRAFVMRADQADGESVESFISAAVEHLGRMDILVNSAGVYLTGDVGRLDSQDSDRQIDVNYRGAISAIRGAATHLVDGGRILVIGSSNSYRSIRHRGVGDYLGTKAGLAAYARGAARDLGDRGITVNVIEPGPIDTEMNPDGSEWSDALKADIPLGRYGRAEEVAELAAFLVGPRAAFISGAQITIDGGMSA
jgi:3-oxoacyl-[acyl-carrier protein] reductase